MRHSLLVVFAVVLLGYLSAHAQEKPLTVPGHTSLVINVAVSPDGKGLESAGYHDKTVRIWLIQALRQIEKPKETVP